MFRAVDALNAIGPEPTYEELKPVRTRVRCPRDPSPEPTYEELKRRQEGVGSVPECWSRAYL